MATNSQVGIVGSGIMGSGIALVAAQSGLHVSLFDIRQDALEKAKSHIVSTVAKMNEKTKITQEQATAILNNIQYVSVLNGFSSCELVVEAVIENLETKQSVFAELEKHVSDTCILTSNTSSVSITSISSKLKHPGRFAGLHFFNPANIMPLVEIIPSSATNPEVVEFLKSKMKDWNKVPVVAKDSPGFIVNRLARPFYSESIRILEEGIADIATIDWALKEVGGFKMGPFELMDLIGNDINYTVTETVWKQLFYDPRFKPSQSQKSLFEAGFYGRKTGKGWYDYALELPTPKKDTALANEIFLRVISMLVNETADSLYLKLASKEDLDIAMIKGVNYPKGLLTWGEEIGIEVILSKLESLYQDYCEDRYRPSILLKKLSEKKSKTFHV